jgi:hypothetical protein
MKHAGVRPEHGFSQNSGWARTSRDRGLKTELLSDSMGHPALELAKDLVTLL